MNTIETIARRLGTKRTHLPLRERAREALEAIGVVADEKTIAAVIAAYHEYRRTPRVPTSPLPAPRSIAECVDEIDALCATAFGSDQKGGWRKTGALLTRAHTVRSELSRAIDAAREAGSVSRDAIVDASHRVQTSLFLMRTLVLARRDPAAFDRDMRHRTIELCKRQLTDPDPLVREHAHEALRFYRENPEI